MIRLGTPVFDLKNQKRGIVIVNYFGNNLLGKILESDPISEGQTMLLNSDGYWLLSPTLDQAWGFMFKDEQRTFGNLYKEVWEEIRLKHNGQINTANGLFTFKTVYPLKEGYIFSTGPGKSFGKSKNISGHDSYKWHIVSFAPSQMINSYSNHLQIKLFLFGAGMFLIVATGSWIIALSVTKRRRDQAQLKVMALFDSLTKLPNRRLFFDRLNMAVEHSRRNKNMFGILYMDLDGFKSVNDSLGHEAGDELLCRVAELLNKICRKSDTIARLGGDEFGIIINQLESAKDAQTVAGKIIATLTTLIQLPSGSAHVGASIGISLFPVDSDDPVELVGLADKSMYKSKNQGENTYTFSGTVPHF